jgi:hypothetical protein
MLDKPRIVPTQVQPAAVIRLTIPRSEIQSVMGSAIAEVMEAIAAQGIAPPARCSRITSGWTRTPSTSRRREGPW